jgi:hypothetical protein
MNHDEFVHAFDKYDSIFDKYSGAYTLMCTECKEKYGTGPKINEEVPLVVNVGDTLPLILCIHVFDTFKKLLPYPPRVAFYDMKNGRIL